MKGRRTWGLVKRGSRRLRVFARERVVPKVVWEGARRLFEGRAPPPSRADELEAKLWRGFSERALADLEALFSSTTSNPREIRDAARVLACWYASHDDYARALDYALQMGPGSKQSALQPLLEADCLMQLGERQRARAVLSRALRRRPSSALYLAMANTHAEPDRSLSASEDDERLAWLNEVYAADGLAPVQRLDTSRPLALDNLSAPSARPVRQNDQPKVSVIVPTYDAAATLRVALESLLAQTWTNLEIIVVDDQSRDDTVAIVRTFAERDPRVVVLPQTQNRGAYYARNRGLERASGRYVTVHDADDWSHPQKLERQVTHLMKHPRALANLSVWARCLPHVYFRGATRASRPWIHYNHSSLLLERELLSRLGGWDEVRIGADSELMRRLRHRQNDERIPTVLRSAPLALALSAPTSLTQQSITHSNTLLHGVRRTYFEASLHWLETQPPGPVQISHEHRPFPAPGVMLPERQTVLSLDSLYSLDFNVEGPICTLALAKIREAVASGAKVGVFQWARYESDPTRSLNTQVLDLAASGSVDVVGAGQQVRAETLYLADPWALQTTIDQPPRLEAHRALLLHGAPAPDPSVNVKERAQHNVQRVFAIEPTWQAWTNE